MLFRFDILSSVPEGRVDISSDHDDPSKVWNPLKI